MVVVEEVEVEMMEIDRGLMMRCRYTWWMYLYCCVTAKRYLGDVPLLLCDHQKGTSMYDALCGGCTFITVSHQRGTYYIVTI